jgi:glucose/arabinose dehydrogenase
MTASIAACANAASVDILATGLANPRGIALGPAGLILVVEAGAGGTPTSMTGHVTSIFHGRVQRLLTLPSATLPNGEVTGPTSVALGGLGNMFITMGVGTSVPFGLLLRANPARTTYFADIAGFELANNPDGVQPPDSNPYGVAVARHGGVLVVDAAANDLLHVAHDGTIETVAVFPPTPNVLTVGGPTVQAVPTSVAVGPDGAWYVGELRGFPFGSASHIWRIEPGSSDVHCVIGSTSGPCVDWASGLRHVVSIAFGPDGDLYASQFGPGPGFPFLPGSSELGSIVRVDAATKAISTVYSGLSAPGGIAVDDDGAIYVTNRSTSAGSGEVLRIEP